MKVHVTLGLVTMILAGAAAAGADKADEVQALSSARLTLTDAIRLAEKEGNGKAVDAEIESAKAGQAQYAVEVLSSDGKKLTEYKLDADTGKILGTKNESIEKVFTRVKPHDLQTAQTSLAGAIRAAEQKTGGKVIDAETEGSGAKLQYDLKVAMADGKTEKVKIDGTTGKVASAK
jgi:uncharacterized membrane protein YkoI